MMTASPDDKAKFCRFCGEQRFNIKVVTEAFLAYIGKRSLMRKTDLTKMCQHLRYLNSRKDGLTRQALHRLTKEIHHIFCEALQLQLAAGDHHSQGLTLEYFPIFLAMVALPRKINVQDLVTFLMEEIQGTVHKESKENTEAMGAERAERERLGAVFALLDMGSGSGCPKCGGGKVASDKCCRKCGHKYEEDGNTTAPNMSGFAAMFGGLGHGGKKDEHFEEVVSLARQYEMPVDVVHVKRIEFGEYDIHNAGTLTYSEFLEALRGRCGIAANEPLPEHLQTSKLLKDDEDASCQVTFEEFLFWSCLTEYSEAMLVTNPQERHIRQLARDHKLPLFDVEHIKDVFDSVNVSKTGIIDEDEFRLTLITLMRIENPNNISSKMVHRLWREVNCHMTPHITFDEFLLWYFKSFDTTC